MLAIKILFSEANSYYFLKEIVYSSKKRKLIIYRQIVPIDRRIFIIIICHPISAEKELKFQTVG
jgi:hypothetical protein